MVCYCGGAVEDRSCQTKYQENDSQTKAWYPPYVKNQPNIPEVVQFESINFENTCLDKQDIGFVQRLRKKKEWEKFLAKTFTPESIELGKKILLEIEQDEWKHKEKEIDDVNKLRLELARDELKEQRSIVQERMEARVGNVRKKYEKEKFVKLPQIRAQQFKELRRVKLMLQKTKRYPDRMCSEGIAGKFRSGEMHAPHARYGRDPLRLDELLSPEAYPQTIQDAYLQIEQSLVHPKTSRSHVRELLEYEKPRKFIEPQIEIPTGDKRPVSDCQTEVMQRMEDRSPMRPILDQPQNGNLDQDVLLLQALIRGRAVQNMIYRQGMANLHQIREMSDSMYRFDRGQRAEAVDIREGVANAIRDHNIAMKMKEKIESVIGRLEGYTVSGVFEFASKELIRLEEERRLHMLALTAEKDRWIRESNEAGRRQEEQQRLRQHDEMFKEITKTHELTTDVLLDDIVQDQIDDTGKAIGTIAARRVADSYGQVFPKPDSEPYNKLAFVSLLADRCLMTQSENDRLKNQLDRKEQLYRRIAKHALSELESSSSAKEESPESGGEKVEERVEPGGDKKKMGRRSVSFSDVLTKSAEKELEKESKCEELGKKDMDEPKDKLKMDIIESDKEMLLHGRADEKDNQEIEEEDEQLNLIVECEPNIKDLIIKSYENENDIKEKLMKYGEINSSGSSFDVTDAILGNISDGMKSMRSRLKANKKELLKKFFQREDYQDTTDSDVSSESSSNSSEYRRVREATKKKVRVSHKKETEEEFQKKCLLIKAERVLDDIVNRAERLIENYQKAAERDGNSLEFLQNTCADVLTEAYRVLSIELLKTVATPDKAELQNKIRPWINTILNEAIKRIMTVFKPLKDIEVKGESPEDLISGEEEEYEQDLDHVSHEELNNLIIETSAPSGGDMFLETEDIPAKNIFTADKFYPCEEVEEEEFPETNEAEEDELELHKGVTLKYMGVLIESECPQIITGGKPVNRTIN